VAEPFLGEIKIISWNYPPKGWMFAAGQLLPINQFQALFSLFGTMYGGDGRVNFALPNFAGRVPVHVGGGFTQGQAAGQSAHTLTISEMPAHNHFVNATNTAGTSPVPASCYPARDATQLYGGFSSPAAMNAASIGNTGGSQAHDNMSPFLALNFIVAIVGIFPSQN
jgi:microcystin-dependent protein